MMELTIPIFIPINSVSRNTFFTAADLFRGKHTEERGEGKLPTLLRRLDSRVEKVSMLPSSHMEMLQVQRYAVNGKYNIHHDGDDRSSIGLPLRVPCSFFPSPVPLFFSLLPFQLGLGLGLGLGLILVAPAISFTCTSACFSGSLPLSYT